MRKFVIFIGLVVFYPSFGYGYIPMPLDSPVVVDYSSAGLSTGLSQGRGTARDSHGWIYAVYLIDSNDLVCCSRSTDNGRTWTRFANLSGAWSAFPNIAIDRGDSIYVDWERQPLDTIGRDIYFSKYNGVFWIPPVDVSNEHEQGGSLASSSLALDGRGMLHLIWLGYGPDIWYSYYTKNVWTTPENVTQGSGTWVASMCADTASNLHLAWQGWQTMYKERTSGVWGVTEQACPTQGYAPSIATDLECRALVAYDDSAIHIAYIMRDNTGWSKPYPISDTIGRFPSITCDKYGRLYVVWGGPERLQKLWYATYDGTAWSAPVRLRNDTAYADYDSRLGFPVSDSGVDLIWTRDRPGGGYQVMYWRLPLLPVGVEEYKGFEGSRVQGFKITPNPFTSFARVAGLEGERFDLYDITGRRVGTYRGDRVGEGLAAGVYFLRTENGASKPVRIVKVR